MLDSDRLTSANKDDLRAVLECREPKEELFNESIKLLSRCLYQYYGKKSVIPVSYTHLDVYKRQGRQSNTAVGSTAVNVEVWADIQ